MNKPIEEHIIELWRENCKKRENNSEKMLSLKWYEEIFTPKLKNLIRESEIIHAEWKIIWDLIIKHDLISSHKSIFGKEFEIRGKIS